MTLWWSLKMCYRVWSIYFAGADQGCSNPSNVIHRGNCTVAVWVFQLNPLANLSAYTPRAWRPQFVLTIRRLLYQAYNDDCWFKDPTHIFTIGDTPVLPKLLKFPGKHGKINIPEQIGTNYKAFGTFLLKDDSGTIVSGIVQEKMYAADKINEAILERWISGKGEAPFTWNTLVMCLRDTDLNVLANNIEEVLQWYFQNM